MAVLTLNPTVAADAVGAPKFGSGNVGQNIRKRDISGAGTTITPIQAGVALKRHVITGGRITVEAAGTILIKSETTARDQIEFPAAGTASWPVGFETGTEEDLAIENPDGLTVVGYIEWVTITAGQYCPATG